MYVYIHIHVYIMYINVCVSLHTFMCMCTYMRTCISRYFESSLNKFDCVYAYMCVCMYVCIHTCTHMCTHMYTHVYMYTYMCMFMCVCINGPVRYTLYSSQTSYTHTHISTLTTYRIQNNIQSVCVR